MFLHWDEELFVEVCETDITRSTIKSEFITLELAGQEAEWLKGFLTDIPLWGKQLIPISLHCDSQAAIGVAHNSIYNGKKRHIRVRHGAVKQLLKHGVISLEYVRSEKNLADRLTKRLPKRVVLKSSRGMGLKPMEQRGMVDIHLWSNEAILII